MEDCRQERLLDPLSERSNHCCVKRCCLHRIDARLCYYLVNPSINHDSANGHQPCVHISDWSQFLTTVCAHSRWPSLILFSFDAEPTVPMKILNRMLLAFTLALSLAFPTLFEPVWHFTAPFLVLLNLPGMLLGFVNGGRFFPPEGHPGQSPIHFTLMILTQTVLWFLVISLVCFVRARTRKQKQDHATPPDSTRGI